METNIRETEAGRITEQDARQPVLKSVGKAVLTNLDRIDRPSLAVSQLLSWFSPDFYLDGSPRRNSRDAMQR